MAVFSREVSVDWKGSLLEGKGEAAAGSGAFTLPVTFPRRIGEPEGVTSPEELVAAAHAACYAMALNATLGRKNAKAAETAVTAKVTAEKGDAGIRVTRSNLTVVASGLEGMSAADFITTATEAEGACPISNALRGNVEILVDASVS
jgi:osmotically inducible protein OsmC